MAFDKRKSLQNALTYTQQAKWDKAIQEYQAILRVDPKDVTVCNNLGDLYARAGRLGEAIDQYLRLGELYRADGLAVKAIAVYKKIAKLDPAQIAAYLACADLYLEQGLVGEAKIQLQGAADLFARAGDPVKVIETYRRLGELDPANVPLLVKLADLLLKQGKGEEAAVEYERAGHAAQAAGQSADAQRLLKKARDLAPKTAGPSLPDAEGLLREGKFEQAAAALAKITAAEPGNAEGWRLLGEACVGAGQGVEALVAFRRGLDLGIAEETLLQSMARAMVLADQPHEAVSLCGRVAEEALNRGEPDDAVAFCRSLVAGGLPATPVRDYLTTLLINLGRDEEARTEALALALAHQGVGDPAAAVQVYHRLLGRNPEDGEVRRLLDALEPDGASGTSDFSLSLGEAFGDADVPGAVAPSLQETGPEITLEGFEDLSTLLGVETSVGEVEEHPEGSFSASGAGGGGDSPPPFAEATIEFVLPEDEPEPAAAAALPMLELEGVNPASDGAEEPEIDLGDFAALLEAPGDEPPPDPDLEPEPEPAPWSADSLGSLSLGLPEDEGPAVEPVGPPVIELSPDAEPIVFPGESEPEEIEAEAIPVLELPEETLTPAELGIPIEEAPTPELSEDLPEPPASGGWLEIPSLADSPGEAVEASGGSAVEAVEASPNLPVEAVEASASSAVEAVEESRHSAVEAAEDTADLPPVSVESDETIAEQLAEAEVYLRYGLEDKARERLLEAVRLAPTSLSPRLKLKTISLERGERAEACQQIIGIIDLLESRGRDGEALAEIRQGLELIPDHPALLDRLAARGAEAEPRTEEPTGLDPAATEALEFLAGPPVGDAEPLLAPEESPAPTESTAAGPVIEPRESVAEAPAEVAEPLELTVLPELVDTSGLPPIECAPVEEVLPTPEPPAGEPEPPTDDSATILLRMPPARPAAEPPVRAEIPVELQALLDGPEAGPMMLPEIEAPERDQGLADDLAEAEFYLAQGMADEARAVHRRLQSLHPRHPAVAELGSRLSPDAPTPAAAPAATPRPATPPVPASPGVFLQDVIPTFTIADDLPTSGTGIPGGFVDLGAELAEELEEEDRATESTPESPLVEGLLREFRRGVREQVDDQDHETHYNLGVAYKDMELYDEAIEEFRMASRGAQRALECAELLGWCFLAKGRIGEAVRHLRGGLEVGGHPREAYHGLRYTLALAHESAGEAERALEQLEVIQAEEPHFRDVPERVLGLRAQLVPRPTGVPPTPAPPPPASTARNRKKISFI